MYKMKGMKGVFQIHKIPLKKSPAKSETAGLFLAPSAQFAF
jgi:hypothetical protein